MKTKLYILLFSSIIFIGCSSKGITVNPRSSWNAEQPLYYKQHVPKQITIHHEGEIFKEGTDAAKHIRDVQVWGMGPARNWKDIPYHFLIDLEGNIYEGRNPFTQGETATDYNPEGHLLITLLGNYEVQEVNKEQLESLTEFIAFCCSKYDISPETIATHKDYAETLCPGKNFYEYFENGYIKKEVKRILTEKYDNK